MRRARLAAPGVLAALAAAGCGGGEEAERAPPGSAEDGRLTAAERARVRASEQAIAAYCRRLALSPTERGKLPSAKQERRAFEAARRLTTLAREKPYATTGPGSDVRLFVSDLIENLEGSNCDPRLISVLEQGLPAPP